MSLFLFCYIHIIIHIIIPIHSFKPQPAPNWEGECWHWSLACEAFFPLGFHSGRWQVCARPHGGPAEQLTRQMKSMPGMRSKQLLQWSPSFSPRGAVPWVSNVCVGITRRVDIRSCAGGINLRSALGNRIGGKSTEIPGFLLFL